MSSNNTIACDLYDFIEIACLHAYTLKMILHDGSELVGLAKTTIIELDPVSNIKRETLSYEHEGERRSVVLSDLQSIEPLDSGAQFGKVNYPQLDSPDILTVSDK